MEIYADIVGGGDLEESGLLHTLTQFGRSFLCLNFESGQCNIYCSKLSNFPEKVIHRSKYEKVQVDKF